MAITAKEFDDLDLTAAEYDSLDLTAEQYDNMSYEDFVNLLHEKLDRFKKVPDDRPISDEISSEINKIYQLASSEIPTLSIPRQTKWSKRPTEILFEAICNALAVAAVAQLPHLVASIISVINQIIN